MQLLEEDLLCVHYRVFVECNICHLGPRLEISAELDKFLEDFSAVGQGFVCVFFSFADCGKHVEESWTSDQGLQAGVHVAVDA